MVPGQDKGPVTTRSDRRRLSAAQAARRPTGVGETGRRLPDRIKEHKRSCKELDVERSEVARHTAKTGHSPDFGEARVLEMEPHWRSRVVKEALWTRELGSSNATKHDLGPSWCL